MKKKFLATCTVGIIIIPLTSLNTFAEENNQQPISSATSKTDLTLKSGSGENTKPIIPTDPVDPDPSTGNKGSLTIPYASNITFGENEIQAVDTDYLALNRAPYVQVNDVRGGASGWTLSASITSFKGTICTK